MLALFCTGHIIVCLEITDVFTYLLLTFVEDDRGAECESRVERKVL